MDEIVDIVDIVDTVDIIEIIEIVHAVVMVGIVDVVDIDITNHQKNGTSSNMLRICLEYPKMRKKT